MITRPYGSDGDRCDCCSLQPAESLLACRNFKFQGKPVFGHELGRWAVCSDCRGLLCTRQWLRLANRSKKNPELFRKLSLHIIPGEEIHCREAEERATKCIGLMSEDLPNNIQARPGRLSPNDDYIAWLDRLYTLPDHREPIGAAIQAQNRHSEISALAR